MDDVLCAMFVGCNQTLVGHPFDTFKVHIQTQNVNQSSYTLRTLYKGVHCSFFTSILGNTFVFPVYEYFHRLNHSHVYCGALAGLCASPLMTVIDGIKISTQLSLKYTPNSVTRGLFATTLRETSATATYFGSYAWLKHDYAFTTLCAGGVAGVLSWIISYPLDVCRSRQISHNMTLLEALGHGRFFDGFGVCVCRAFVVNASNFYVYEEARRRISCMKN